VGKAGQGRPTKPSALKVLHGDRKDRLNTEEPVPSGDILPPAGLSERALAVWERLAPDLTAKGVLSAWDTDEFAIVCDAVARHRTAAERLDLEGETGENRFGERVVSPVFRVWAESASVIAKFGGRFGLSPSDRASLKVGDATKKPSEDLLTG
jgi:P27 family predicted phage terminase small subunit